MRFFATRSSATSSTNGRKSKRPLFSSKPCPNLKRRRQKEKLQKLHGRIRNVCRDFQMKTAHALAQEQGCVYVEDDCGYGNNADIVGATNVRRKGRTGPSAHAKSASLVKCVPKSSCLWHEAPEPTARTRLKVACRDLLRNPSISSKEDVNNCVRRMRQRSFCPMIAGAGNASWSRRLVFRDLETKAPSRRSACKCKAKSNA